MVKQFYGTVEIDGVSNDAVLSVDEDRQSEALVQWWGPKTAPRAVLARCVSNGDEIELVPVLVYKADDNGELKATALTDEELKEIEGLKAKLRYRGDDLIGEWGNAANRGGALRFNPAPEGESIHAVKCTGWADFRQWVQKATTDGMVAYRGHGDSRFRLKTTLQRAGRHRLERYCRETLPEFARHAEVVLDARLRLSDPDDYSVILGLAQHHGLPTPLLDWTHSPYVAAFFAFTDAHDWRGTRDGVSHVRIYALSKAFLERYTMSPVVLPYFMPYITPLSISPRHNPRLYAQQGLFLATNAANPEFFISNLQRRDNASYLCAADVPVASLEEALADLKLMGLTAATMFPGLDGVCRMMRVQMSYAANTIRPPEKPISTVGADSSSSTG